MNKNINIKKLFEEMKQIKNIVVMESKNLYQKAKTKLSETIENNEG